MEYVLLFLAAVMTSVAVTHGQIMGQEKPVVSCDFESNMCGYRNWHANTHNFTVKEASSVAAGPPTDHTLGTGDGHYAYVEGSGYILSYMEQGVNSDSDSCLSFWYFLSDDNVVFFNVWSVGPSGVLKYDHEKAGRNKEWIQGHVDLPKANDHKVIFIAQLSDLDKTKHHFLALDDIKVLEKPCAELFD